MSISTIFSNTNSVQANQTNVISQSSSQVYNKRDTNQDGVVSDQETLAYNLKHPSEAKNSQQIQKSSADNNDIVGRNLNTTA